MKLYDVRTNQMFRGTMMVHDGKVIRIFNKENDELAIIPSSQAKLIFNEEEIPYEEGLEK